SEPRRGGAGRARRSGDRDVGRVHGAARPAHAVQPAAGRRRPDAPALDLALRGGGRGPMVPADFRAPGRPRASDRSVRMVAPAALWGGLPPGARARTVPGALARAPVHLPSARGPWGDPRWSLRVGLRRG